MSMTAGNAYQLVDGLLDKGLVFVAAYLEKTLKRSILIVDHRGLIHYPNLPANAARVDIYIQIPSNIDKQEFYYRKTDRCLFYPIDCNGSSAYIIVKNLSAKMVGSTLTILTEAKLATKCYFANLSRTSQNRCILAQKIQEYLFSAHYKSIREVLDQSDFSWDAETPFYVCVMEADDHSTPADWEQIAASFREHLHASQPEAIIMLDQHCLTAVLPARHNDSSPETCPDWACLTTFKEAAEKNNKQRFSMAFGRSHAFTEIKKSFHEARFTLTLSRLLGARSAVQSFSDLGLAALIFSADIEQLKCYCQASLGKILDYDRSSHSDLIASLRKLLDNNFNWKSTADQLFIHINTLYYRVNKVEQLLNIDLSKMDTRVNLYIAIKVWDTLNLNGLLD